MSLEKFLSAVIEKKKEDRVLIKVKKDGEWKEFFLSQGKILHIESSDIREKFSSILVMEKIVSKEELREAIKKVGGDVYKIDSSIIELKNLSKIDVYKNFRKQMKYVVGSLLKWNEFDLKISNFDESFQFKKYPIFIEDLLMTISRRYISNKFRKEVLELFNEFTEIKLNLPFDILRKIPFTKYESNIIGKLSSITRLSDLKSFVDIPEDKIINIISSFLVSGIISIKKGEQESFSISTTKEYEREDGGEEEKVKELDVKLEEIRNFFDDLKNKNYFEIFELTPENFNIGKLKKKYLELIREYHPDKYARFNSEALNDLLEDLSNYINTAYETLKDDELRHEYENNLAKFSGNIGKNENESEKRTTPEKVAKESFERGRMLVNAKSYAEAVSYLKAAVRIKPENAEYNAYLGYAMSKTSQFKREAEKYLLKAIELAPMQINYYIHLGRLYKDAKLYTKALRIFQEGLAWDNSNKIILKEIDEINEILNRKNKKGFWGELGKLFNKK